MQLHRRILALTVVVGMALVAYLNARAVSALVEGTIAGSMGNANANAEANANANASASASASASAKSAGAILDRNPFDHLTGSLRAAGDIGGLARELDTDPRTAPLCEGVRPLVVVGDEDQGAAFASLEVGGKRVLRRRGGDVGDKQVAYVGRDRVWLSGSTGLCQALLFGTPTPPKPPVTAEGRTSAEPGARSALETEIGKQIVKTGPNEYAIERSAVDRIIEAQAELMKQRIVQDKEGDRVVGVKIFNVKPGSVVSMLGIENGDRLETINGFEFSSPERMLEAFARLRAGADKLQVHLTRAGKPVNLDYAIR